MKLKDAYRKHSRQPSSPSHTQSVWLTLMVTVLAIYL